MTAMEFFFLLVFPISLIAFVGVSFLAWMFLKLSPHGGLWLVIAMVGGLVAAGVYGIGGAVDKPIIQSLILYAAGPVVTIFCIVGVLFIFLAPSKDAQG